MSPSSETLQISSKPERGCVTGISEIGNVQLRRSKSVAAGDSQRKCQNGYRAAEDMSGISLVPRKHIICNSSKAFSLRVSAFVKE
ncbi:hypothetical protein AVEN_229803-1 [Araneus ventricosus]|uniref:Uncharacterized protein n=1 Tax=Araneus ventricosus TaxID=182803 RepID=A0A4Y2LHE9_ARAVE|nr:hypothetical protein AVEN_229803-1 [Araneus ventricosus]